LAVDRHRWLRREQRVEAAGILRRETRAILPVLHWAVSRPDLHHTPQAHCSLLQFHPGPALRAAVHAYTRLVLVASRVASQSSSRSVLYGD